MKRYFVLFCLIFLLTMGNVGSVAADAGIKVGETFTVDVSSLLIELDELRPDERPEQIADWAVYGTLMHADLTSEELRTATYDMSPIRFPYLEEVFHFDYGPGRRIFLPGDEIWLFVSERDERPQATLARLADRVRMERGEIPPSFVIFRYRSDLPSGTIEVERAADIEASRLFSSELGYIEERVSGLNDFEAWLDRVDDVTHMRLLAEGVLELGGRRIEEARTESVTLEDVAALYQAHVELAEFAEILQIDTGGPGFSLDPQWDSEGLVRDLELLLDDPAVVVRAAKGSVDPGRSNETSAREVSLYAEAVEQSFEGIDFKVFQIPEQWISQIRLIIEAIRDQNSIGFEGFEKLLDENEGDAGRVLALINYLAARNHIQCARYDGPLKGTQVGMNLFYTDLLAKLWVSVDFAHEAPLDTVYGFLTEPVHAPKIDPAYWSEIWRLPWTRIWFGPKKGSYKGRPESREGLNFSHISSRVYSAGSNSSQPSKETVSNESSRQTFGWWDRHFARVADYEQQYHVQNQIMKWSVLTGWMVDQGLLNPLSDVEVDRSQRFDRWLESTARLKFTRKIPFVPEERWPGNSECLEILKSYPFDAGGKESVFISGGVSLASPRAMDSAVRIKSSIPKPLRRGTIIHEKSQFDRLKSVEGGSFIISPARKGRHAEVKVAISENARLRSGGAEFAIRELRTKIDATTQKGEILLGSDFRSLGRFSSERSTKGTRLEWQDGFLEIDRTILQKFPDSSARELATSREFLPRRGSYVLENSEGQGELVIIRSRNAGTSEKSARIFRQPSGRKPVDGLPLLRSGRAVPDGSSMKSLDYEAVALDPADAMAQVNKLRWQRLRPLDEFDGIPGEVERVFSSRGPPHDVPRVTVHTHDGHQLPAFVHDSALYIYRDPAFNNVRFNNLVVEQGLTGKDVRSVIRGGSSVIEGRPITGGTLDSAAEYFARDPVLDHDAATKLSDALKLLRGENPKRAAEKIRDATSKLSEKDSLPSSYLDSFRKAGSPAVEGYARTRMAGSGIGTRLANKVDLIPRGMRIHTYLNRADLPEGEVVSRSAWAARFKNEAPSSVYVEDTYLLNRLDWDGAPGPSFAEAIQRHDIRIELIDTTELKSFRPSLLLSGDGGSQPTRTLVRREIPPSPRKKTRSPKADLARYLVVLHTCDDDGDGHVSSSEQDSCLQQAG